MLNKMGSIPFIIDDSQYLSLLGVLNKMGSILFGRYADGDQRLLGVLNKMGSIRVRGFMHL